MTIKSAVKVLVPVALMAFCASFVQARPAVDASPDRAKYQVFPSEAVRKNVWVPGSDAQMKFIGTLRPRDAAEVGDAGWVICPGCFERGFSLWEEQRDYIRPLGVKFLRVQVSWAKTEREKGKFDFTWLDELVDYCGRNGINPIFETSYGNPIHEDMVAAAKLAKLAYIVNVVIDEQKRTVAAFAGDPILAHRSGCDFLLSYAQVSPAMADIVITGNGGAPLDQNLYQCVKSMTAAEATCLEGGTIILCAECVDGYYFLC